MEATRSLSDLAEHDWRRYRAYSIVRRLFAAMDDGEDADDLGGRALQALARDVVDAIALLFKGSDGRTPARIAVVFAEAMLERARAGDDRSFVDVERVAQAAALLRGVSTVSDRWRELLASPIAEIDRAIRVHPDTEDARART